MQCCHHGNTCLFVVLTVNAGSVFALKKYKEMAASVSSVVLKFYDDYSKTTPTKLKLIDSYLFYIFLTGVTQFVYCCLVGTFPFNSFLSGFISCVGSFVLAGTYFGLFQKFDNNCLYTLELVLWCYGVEKLPNVSVNTDHNLTHIFVCF